jgi:hypothetical protein
MTTKESALYRCKQGEGVGNLFPVRRFLGTLNPQTAASPWSQIIGYTLLVAFLEATSKNAKNEIVAMVSTTWTVVFAKH